MDNTFEPRTRSTVAADSRPGGGDQRADTSDFHGPADAKGTATAGSALSPTLADTQERGDGVSSARTPAVDEGLGACSDSVGGAAASQSSGLHHSCHLVFRCCRSGKAGRQDESGDQGAEVGEVFVVAG